LPSLPRCPSARPTPRPARHAPACAHLSATGQRGRRAGGVAAGACGWACACAAPCLCPCPRPHHAQHALFAHARTHLTGSNSSQAAQDARAIAEGLTRDVSAETTTLALQQKRSDRHIERMAIHMAKKLAVRGSSSSGGSSGGGGSGIGGSGSSGGK
jgi:hypothetical protein